MRTSVQKNSKHIVKKVVGLVLIIPLLLPLAPIPFGLGRLASLAAVGGSIYGAWYAKQNASRGVAVGACVMALLNACSLAALGTPSIIWLIYFVSWAYGSGRWIHWGI